METAQSLSSKRGAESVPASGKCQPIIYLRHLDRMPAPFTPFTPAPFTTTTDKLPLRHFKLKVPVGPLNTRVLRETTAQAVM